MSRFFSPVCLPLQFLPYLENHLPSYTKEVVKQTARIVCLSIRIFPVLQGLSYVGYGIKIFIWDGIRAKVRLKNQRIVRKVSAALQWFYARIRIIQHETSRFSLIEGVTYAGAGICGVIIGACRIGLTTCPTLLNLATSTSRGFFLFSDLLSLEYYVNIFFSASEIASVGSYHENQVANQMRITAVLGILACLGYLLAASVLLLGGPAGVAFAICCVSGLTSCIKVLYDFFFRSPELLA